jgi:general stress protein 26
MDIISAARGALDSHPFGFLATIASSGSPSLRLVQHLGVDYDMTLWIGTSRRSRKAQEIGSGARVGYAVENRGSIGYVTVAGQAGIVEDDEARLAKWIPGLKSFFPGGATGDDFVLIRLRADTVELMDFTLAIHPDPYGLRPALVMFDGTEWTVRDNRPPGVAG